MSTPVHQTKVEHQEKSYKKGDMLFDPKTDIQPPPKECPINIPQQVVPEQSHEHLPKSSECPSGKTSLFQQKCSIPPVGEPTLDLFNSFVAKNTHCLLGRTGIRVSRISLGTMNFGKIDSKFGERPGQLEEAEAHKILDRYVELGGNCIETANFYPWFGSQCGESENIIGKWLKNQQRENLFLVTQVRMPTDPKNLNSVGLSRSNIIDSVDSCLQRLNTDYIDLLQLNGWDYSVSITEVCRTLNELVTLNKVRYIGINDVKGWQLQKFIDTFKMLNLHRCVCFEGEYNLLTRGVEWEVVDVCKNERIGFFAYSPFKYGFLTNDYNPSSEKPVEGSRIACASYEKPNLAAMAEPFEEMRKNPAYSKLLSVFDTIGKQRNITSAQIALLWTLQRGFVTSCIVGFESIQELEENMATITGEMALTQQEMHALNQASQFRLEYPYNCPVISLAGYKIFQPSEHMAFEQLGVLTDTLSLDKQDEFRLHPTETWHESKSLRFPEQQYFPLKKPLSQQEMKLECENMRDQVVRQH